MAASDIMYVKKPFICVVEKELLQYLLKYALHHSSLRLKCYYSQRNSVGTDRENIIPGNLCIRWKLNEAWPMKKELVTFLRLLKLLKLKMNSITALRLLTFSRWGGANRTIFFPVTFANVGISPLNFLTFSFNPFATLVRIKCQSQIIELEPRPPIKNADFLVKSL